MGYNRITQLLLLFLTGLLSEFLSRYQCTKKGVIQYFIYQLYANSLVINMSSHSSPFMQTTGKFHTELSTQIHPLIPPHFQACRYIITCTWHVGQESPQVAVTVLV